MPCQPVIRVQSHSAEDYPINVALTFTVCRANLLHSCHKPELRGQQFDALGVVART
ncbi:hypothetical protein BH09ACT7_BH09ACT7_48090 [soil metagenome]